MRERTPRSQGRGLCKSRASKVDAASAEPVANAPRTIPSRRRSGRRPEPTTVARANAGPCSGGRRGRQRALHGRGRQPGPAGLPAQRLDGVRLGIRARRLPRPRLHRRLPTPLSQSRPAVRRRPGLGRGTDAEDQAARFHLIRSMPNGSLGATLPEASRRAGTLARRPCLRAAGARTRCLSAGSPSACRRCSSPGRTAS
jgi:hypothetical protein